MGYVQEQIIPVVVETGKNSTVIAVAIIGAIGTIVAAIIQTLWRRKRK